MKRYTLIEEVLNSITHGIGLLISIVSTSVMVILSYGEPSAVISSIIFGFSLILLYSASTLYHAFPVGKVKSIFRIFDHTCIPILIAGSYTPFCLIVLQGNKKALYVTITVWLLCILCIVLNVISLEKTEKLSLIIYVVMGWLVVCMFNDIKMNIPPDALNLLILGGLSYTVGIIFYKWKKEYMHTVWHVFVLAGSIFHIYSVIKYIIPLSAV